MAVARDVAFFIDVNRGSDAEIFQSRNERSYVRAHVQVTVPVAQIQDLCRSQTANDGLILQLAMISVTALIGHRKALV